MDQPTLSNAAIALAVADLGTIEVGTNWGPAVRRYLATVGIFRPEPWCCAALVTWFVEASAMSSVVCPVPITGSCLELWERTPVAARDSNPSVGAVYVLKHSATTGHVGIIVGIDGGTSVREISGNTNATGSREGNCVFKHSGSSPEVIHGGELLGYLVYDRLVALVS